jgi:hypothetical protein
MQNAHFQTISKNDGLGKTANEDHVLLFENRLVVSDGAGGTGLFADKWSEYLCTNLPNDPISTFDELCVWQEAIWEEFYKEYKPIAEEKGIGAKFLQEGSSATLVALWQFEDHFYWCAYGDSVLFHFGKKNLKFASIANPSQFNQSPWLLNWKDTPDEKGFQAGIVKLEKGDKFLIATDTLAQYILISYLTSNPSKANKALLKELAESGSRLANTYQQMVIEGYGNKTFQTELLEPLLQSLVNENMFEMYIQQLFQKEVIGLDDYSLVEFK